MGKGRLEAFSDGVIAIIITIMVLEIKVPHGDQAEALAPLVPVLLSYVLSFVYLGIYWNNHHHLLHTASRVTGPILWANLHLLFWLSLVPASTSWIGETHFAPTPTALYGAILFMAGLAYYILQLLIIRSQGPDSIARAALSSHWKERSSVLLYLAGTAVAFWAPPVALALFVLVALLWLIPDPRIERAMAERDG